MNPEDFRTSDEQTAYEKHLEERGLEDTDANKATWFAAREFYSGVYASSIFSEATEGSTDGQEDATEVTSSVEAYQRHIALSLAVQNSDGQTGNTVVEKAKAYLSFLQNSES